MSVKPVVHLPHYTDSKCSLSQWWWGWGIPDQSDAVRPLSTENPSGETEQTRARCAPEISIFRMEHLGMTCSAFRRRWSGRLWQDDVDETVEEKGQISANKHQSCLAAAAAVATG